MLVNILTIIIIIITIYKVLNFSKYYSTNSFDLQENNQENTNTHQKNRDKKVSACSSEECFWLC